MHSVYKSNFLYREWKYSSFHITQTSESNITIPRNLFKNEILGGVSIAWLGDATHADAIKRRPQTIILENMYT